MIELTHLQINQYLQRIGIYDTVSLDLSGLNRLLYAHLTNVPFEALDVWHKGICPSLELSDLYDKVVEEGRGGYCFELNTLFRSLLNALGFDAYQAIASLLDENGIAAPPAHNVILCRLDGKSYLLDVGFGGPVPTKAMELRPHIAENFRLSLKDGFWYLYRQEDAAERPVICFRDQAAELVELEPLNYYISQKPDVHFRNRVFVSQRFADGRVCSLMGDTLTVRSAGTVTTQEVKSMPQIKEVLISYFHFREEAISFLDQ